MAEKKDQTDESTEIGRLFGLSGARKEWSYKGVSVSVRFYGSSFGCVREFRWSDIIRLLCLTAVWFLDHV